MEYENRDLDFMTSWVKLQPVLAEIEDINYLEFLENHEKATKQRYDILERIVTRRFKIERRTYMQRIWYKIYGLKTNEEE